MISCAGRNSHVIVGIESYSSLYSDCEHAFTSKNAGSDAYSAGSTFFIKATEKPECLLEQMALDIFNFHANRLGMEYDKENSGAEWWTLCIDSRDDVGFHWDRDYGLEENSGVLKYPKLGSVTYLTNFGGPTLVLPVPGQTSNKNMIDMKFTTAMMSKPQIAKHTYFDGRLLHAAPGDYDGNASDNEESEGKGEDSHSDSEDEDDEEEGVTRVTFLVNMWFNHMPVQSVRFPANQLVQMSKIDTKGNKNTSVLAFNKNNYAKKKLMMMNPVDASIRTWKFHDLLRYH